LEKKIKKSLIKKNTDNLTEFDLLPLEIKTFIITPDGDSFAVLLADNKYISIALNNMESTMLAFIHSGCNNMTKINTIYDLYIKTLRDLKTTLIACIIETHEGDIVYGRLCLEDSKKRQYFCQCTGGDTIVLSLMTDAKLQIIRRTLDAMDDFDLEEERDFMDE
jgi:hypothetical protein